MRNERLEVFTFGSTSRTTMIPSLSFYSHIIAAPSKWKIESIAKINQLIR
jgi:hypothetical protein